MTAENFRIDEKLRRFVLAFLGKVDHQHAQRLADLDGGKADARRVIHGVQHVIGKFQQALSTLSTGLETVFRIGSGNRTSGFSDMAVT